MANYYLSGDYNNTIDVILSLTEHTDTTANTSTFDYTLYIYKKNNTSYSYSRGNHYCVTIGGFTTGDQTAGYSLGGIPIGGTYTLLTGTSSAIAHNSDGSGTVTVSAYVRQDQLANYNFSLSQSVSMTNIPRASKPSAGNVTIGNAVTINTNRASSSFTHTLQYKLGTMSSYTNLATNVGASYSWTVPISVIDYISNAASATVTINCITYNGSTQIGTATCTFTATIPSSTISLSSTAAITMGTNKSVTVTNPASSKLAVTVTWVFGKVNGTLTSSFGTYSYNWPVATFASGIPAAMSGTVTVTQTTKRGSATIGNATSVSFTLTLPDANKNPSISSISLSDANGYAASYGSYLSGKSRLSWTINASAGSGSSINYYFLSVTNLDNQSTRTGAVDIPPSVGTGTKTVTARVRDQRYGSSGSEQVSLSTTIPVIQYKAPYLTSTTVVRSKSDGTADPASGTYIRMKGTVNWTRITGGSSTNSVSAKYRTRQQNGTWSGYTNLTLSNDQFDVTKGTFSYEVGWEVQIVVADSITTSGSTYSYTVGSSVFPIDIYPSQISGIAFGKVAVQNQLYSAYKAILNEGKRVWSTGSIGTAAGYVKICNINIIATYANTPIHFSFFRRNFREITDIFIRFSGENSTDPALDKIYYKGANAPTYIVKTGTSAWSVYMSVSAYDVIDIVDYSRPEYLDNRVTLSWDKTYSSTLPSDTVQAVKATSADCLPSSGGTLSGALTVNGTIRSLGANIWSGIATDTGNRQIGAISTGGNFYLASNAGSTGLKQLRSMNANSEYKTIIEVDQSNNATFYGKCSNDPTATNTYTKGHIRFPGVKVQIAWIQVSWTGAISNAWNTLYESTAAISLGSWSANFSQRPAVSYSAKGTSASRGIMIQNYAIQSTSSGGSVYLVNTGSIASQAYTVTVIGIGPYS